jgi:hypothetical protein
MEGVESGLSDIYSCIAALKDAVESLQKDTPCDVLSLHRIYHAGIVPSIRDSGVVAGARERCEICINVSFICSYALVRNDEADDWIKFTDYGVFLAQQQWRMLRHIHTAEITHWFKHEQTPRWNSHWPIQTSRENCDEVFLKFKRVISKEIRSDNEIVLSLEFKLAFPMSFYFGSSWCCVARDLFSTSGVREVGDCAKEHTTCTRCQKRLVCQKHEAWAEKVTCSCIK